MGNIKDFTSKLDGNAKIISFLSDNAEILNRVSRFQVAVKKLSAIQKKLKALNSKLGKDTTDIEKDKNNRREELVAVTIPVIRIMQVFAHDKEKENLQRRLYFLTPEFIHNFLDHELIKTSKKIWLIASKYGGYSRTFSSKIKSLLNPDRSKATIKFEKEYGLHSDMIKNLEEAILRFIEALLLYDGEMAEKEKVALKIKKINKQTKKLLADKIDRFAILFESENPDFFNEYSRLRGNQFRKQVKESLELEADPINILVEEVPENQAELIVKSKTSRKSKSEKK